jgi:hypothetical protein
MSEEAGAELLRNAIKYVVYAYNVTSLWSSVTWDQNTMAANANGVAASKLVSPSACAWLVPGTWKEED